MPWCSRLRSVVLFGGLIIAVSGGSSHATSVGPIDSTTSATTPSVLEWWPGSGAAAPTDVWVTVNRMNDRDRAALPATTPDLSQYNSLVDIFTKQGEIFGPQAPGTVEQLRERLRNDPLFSAAKDLDTHPMEPNRRDDDQHSLIVRTFLKPYEVQQEAFLARLQAYHHAPATADGALPAVDFFSTAERRYNHTQLGDVASPLVDTMAEITPAQLRSTFGRAVVIQPDRVTLYNDNVVNPLRWFSPLNEIHHHEQASLALSFDTRDDAWASTHAVLDQWRSRSVNALPDTRIMLEYDLEIEVYQQPEPYHEASVWEMYALLPPDARHPKDAQHLTGRTHWNAHQYQDDIANISDDYCAAAQQMTRYLTTRFIPENMHISLRVNWQNPDRDWYENTYTSEWHEHGVYRSSEFILASKNLQPSTYYPRTTDCGDGTIAYGYRPTDNATLNPFIRDGANNGRTSWYRIPVDLLKDPIFTDPQWPGWASQLDPIVTGGDHYEIGEGVWKQRVHGRIDLTHYYKLAFMHDFFPGQEGYWTKQTTGFDAAASTARNPDERHGIAGVGVILENHGTRRVVVHVNTVNVWMTQDP